MVASLVWGAFLASEAFAKGERDDFAKKQAEANRPKTIYFDTATNSKLNENDYMNTVSAVYAARNLAVAPENKESKEYKQYQINKFKTDQLLNNRFKQIGTMDNKGKENFLPDTILNNILYGKQKPSTIKIISDSGRTFLDMSTFAQVEPENFKNKRYVTQKVSFTRQGLRQDENITDARPDIKTEPVKNSVLVRWNNGKFEEVDNQKNATFRVTKVVNASGTVSYLNANPITKDKPEPTVKVEKIFKGKLPDGNTIQGTMSQIYESLDANFEDDETISRVEDSLVQVGNIDVKYNSEGNIVSRNNRIIFKEDEKKIPTKLQYTVVGRDGDNKLFSFKVPEGKNYEEFIEEKGLNKYPSQVTKIVELNSENNKTNVTQYKDSTSSSAAIEADSGGSLITLNSLDGKSPPVKFPNIDPNNKNENPYEKVTRASLFYNNNKAAFAKSAEARNKFALAITPTIIEAYNIRAKTSPETPLMGQAVGTVYNKDIRQFTQNFPLFSDYMVSVDGNGTQLTLGEYIIRAANKTNTEDFIKSIQKVKDIHPNDHVAGAITTFKATPNMANKLSNVNIDDELSFKTIIRTDPKYAKMVDYVLNMGKTNEEKTEMLNFLMGSGKLKGTIGGNSFDYTGNQPGFDPLLNLLNIQYPFKPLQGKVKMENGIDLIRAMMNPGFNTSDRFTAANQNVKTAALVLANGNNGDYTRAYNFLLRFAPKYGDGVLAMKAKYRGSKKSVQDIEKAANGVMVSAINAREQALALRDTYFYIDETDGKRKMYAFGAAAGQFLLDVNGAIYVGVNLYKRAKDALKTTLGVDDMGQATILDESDSGFFSKVERGMLKSVNEFTSVMNSSDPDIQDKYKGQEGLEAEARKKNKAVFDKILKNMQIKEYKDSDGKDRTEEFRAYARRSFHKFMLAYQLAAAIQGGTGGRTISDQDVQNILSAFNFNFLSDPKFEVEAIDRSIQMLDRLITYNKALAIGSPVEKYTAIATDNIMNMANGQSLTNLNSLQVASFVREVGSPLSQGKGDTPTTVVPATQIKIQGVTLPKALKGEKAYRYYRQIEKETNLKDENELIGEEDFIKEWQQLTGQGA